MRASHAEQHNAHCVQYVKYDTRQIKEIAVVQDIKYIPLTIVIILNVLICMEGGWNTL